MTRAEMFSLPERGVIALTGADAAGWLNNLISNDVLLLLQVPVMFSGLLSPQGKLLFEFFVYRAGDGLLIETALPTVETLIKRLRLYKLRAKIELQNVTVDWAVIWGVGALPSVLPSGTMAAGDPRSPGGLWRGVCRRVAATGLPVGGPYLETRMQLGIGEAPQDYALGDTFPHEANFDLQNGASFTKGCYVGQEVVSRMQNKTVVRKRVVRVSAADVMSSGYEVTVGAAVIGKIGSVAGTDGLAMVRMDRVVEAIDGGVAIETQGCAITIDAEAVRRYRQSVLDRPVIDL